jgi:cellulose synthase operon protein YhjQ
VKIISIVSAKGGVGKSTISANLCSALKKMGHDVLAVDLDPQNSLRLHLGISPSQGAGIATINLKSNQWQEAIVAGNDDCPVLPFGKTNEAERTAFEHQLREHPSFLREHLNKLHLAQDTVVVIDTPPGPSVYLKQALSTANIAVVVILPDAASYATIPMIDDLITHYCQDRRDFIDTLYVVNQLDRSRQLADDMADIVTLKYQEKNTIIIHQDQSIPESLAFNQDVSSYAPDSRGAQDMIDLTAKISHVLSEKSQAKVTGL